MRGRPTIGTRRIEYLFLEETNVLSVNWVLGAVDNFPMTGSMFPGRDYLRRYETKDVSLIIRRFLSAEKFRDLTRTYELFFCPASKFIDQLEGRNTKASHATADRQLASWGL